MLCGNDTVPDGLAVLDVNQATDDFLTRIGSLDQETPARVEGTHLRCFWVWRSDWKMLIWLRWLPQNVKYSTVMFLCRNMWVLHPNLKESQSERMKDVNQIMSMMMMMDVNPQHSEPQLHTYWWWGVGGWVCAWPTHASDDQVNVTLGQVYQTHHLQWILGSISQFFYLSFDSNGIESYMVVRMMLSKPALWHPFTDQHHKIWNSLRGLQHELPFPKIPASTCFMLIPLAAKTIERKSVTQVSDPLS